MDQSTQSQTQQWAVDPPLVTLFRHNLWANLRLLDACAALDEQQLMATAAGVYGPIYDTLFHIVRSEQGYLMHLTGNQPESRPRREDKPDIDALRAHTRLSGERFMVVAANATTADVVILEDDETRWTIPASMILTQAINHATEHRAQVMTILTQQGIAPPDLSGWTFAEETVPPPVPIDSQR